MTVAELAKLCETPVCAKSGFDGKILCKRFDPQKHVELGRREVTAVWAEIKVENTGGFSSFAHPVLMAFVDGSPEYKAKLKKMEESK